MIFVTGIHGVGKTTFCYKLAKEKKCMAYSASELISRKIHKIYTEKKVDSIDQNQKYLINAVNSIYEKEKEFILDGHLCLLDENGNIKQIKKEVFKLLNIDLLIVIVDKPELIQDRLRARSKIDWNVEFIKEFQNREVHYAQRLSRELDIDCIIYNEQTSDRWCFGKSIVLPIKPVYASKILNGEKKYEYRKHLCCENIDKIYIYATAPVKKIIGEVKVCKKMYMDKGVLWKYTRNESGINEEYFDEYFCGKKACAYELEEPVSYMQPVDLSEMGIHYSVQSYAYVDTLKI